MLTSQFGLEY